MKKYCILIVLLVCSICLSAQLQVGGGLSFGTEIGKPGIVIKGNYLIKENIDGSVSLNFFFPDKEGAEGFESKFSVWTLNFDGHYLLQQEGKVILYPLAGINLAFSTFESQIPNFFGTGTTTFSGSDSSFGLNVGGGAQLSLNEKINGFAEVKYVLSEFDQLVIGAGILFTLN
ncbi:MAG: outer membrane beta-barrel protein [Bacteroidota bacterium]